MYIYNQTDNNINNMPVGLPFRERGEVPQRGVLAGSNQVRVVAFSLPQLTQASLIQKNQTLQNRFLISVTLRWHRVSVACKNQSFKS